MDAEEINLGFLEDAPPQSLRRWCFPSKVGGKPEWLETRQLPKSEDLTCPTCKEIQTFLLQVYAPVDDCAGAFHRALLLFGCMRCGSGFSLFRCQMPKENALYPSFPLASVPSEVFWSAWREAATAKSLSAPRGKHLSEREELRLALAKLQAEEARVQSSCCPVCGLPGDTCNPSGATALEDAQAASMKTKVLQLLRLRNDEATAAYERKCEEEGKASARVVDVDEEEAVFEEFERQAERGLPCLHRRCRIFAAHRSRGLCCALPEFELAVGEEEEDAEDDGDTSAAYAYERELLRKYEEEEKADPDAVLDPSEQDAFENIHEEHTSQDPQLSGFLKRCSAAPANRGQVLRYALGGKPLWPFTPGQLASQPPACERCGAKRQFEFQVLPQFLFELRKSAGAVADGGAKPSAVAGKRDKREAAGGDRAGSEGRAAGDGETAQEANGGSQPGAPPRPTPQIVEEEEVGGACRAEAAQAAAERLHFALVCVYTCKAHCGGAEERQNAEAVQARDAVAAENHATAYPYIKEFVYVQPDPFFVKQQKKETA
ncbi:programmed cell death protein 2, c-terminal domain-containing protein [Besnoitia besnoiti]|uniref:Programmed cell death protein 2, c-terminal domain-containing protein n=1 Tax=Besnoitia besnoiti TaxID=94643 RepID=A0A2A9M7G9_BESBE|nr:programmed cell death protein 2, c-terminal domain-containing protein [Besnoitia besnoiti]PFH31613.1 programmed cell death protein 2, c-terminal domain-containing protein [Besnoitia besnoiti]